MDTNSSLEGLRTSAVTTITCPVVSNSEWKGEFAGLYGAACLVDVTNGGTIDGVDFQTQNGWPMDLWIATDDCCAANIVDYGVYCSSAPAQGNSCKITYSPTMEPTSNPTSPTIDPTMEPTDEPTYEPTIEPTSEPTIGPTNEPSMEPTAIPTLLPTELPTSIPTFIPTKMPSIMPSSNPSVHPTISPTDRPSISPSNHPTTPALSIPTSKNLRAIITTQSINIVNKTTVSDSIQNNDALISVIDVILITIVSCILILCIYYGFTVVKRQRKLRQKRIVADIVKSYVLYAVFILYYFVY